jgi:hypothetical protein
MTMGNGARTKPKGLVSIQVQLTATTSITVYAWLMPSGPFDFIMGSDVLLKHKANIDYANHVLWLQVGEVSLTLPFYLGPELKHEATKPLFATTTILIPAKHHALVPVNISRRENAPEGQWGTVSNLDDGQDYLLPAHSFVTHRHQNWVQVPNMSNEPITIHRGKAIATFHRQDKDTYEFRDVNLDEIHNEITHASAAAQRSNTEPTTVSLFAGLEYLDKIKIDDDHIKRLDDSQHNKLKKLILEFHILWDRESKVTSAATNVECDIELTEPADPAKIRARRGKYNPAVRKGMQEHVTKLKDRDIIRDSCRPIRAQCSLCRNKEAVPGLSLTSELSIRSSNATVTHSRVWTTP